MNRGKLIVIEGLDGSGKATQAACLAETLLAAGKEAKKITFPDYDSQSSALVKMYLAGEIGDVGAVNAYAASAFYAADRYISYETGWKKQYQAGHTIVADRYVTSNAAHQMPKLAVREWDSYLDWLYDFEFVRMGLPRPDLVLYLDLAPQASQSLLDKRYGGEEREKDIHERNLPYLEKCRQAALYAADKLGWEKIPCGRGAGIATVEEIAAQIWETVKKQIDGE